MLEIKFKIFNELGQDLDKLLNANLFSGIFKKVSTFNKQGAALMPKNGKQQTNRSYMRKAC